MPVLKSLISRSTCSKWWRLYLRQATQAVYVLHCDLHYYGSLLGNVINVYDFSHRRWARISPLSIASLSWRWARFTTSITVVLTSNGLSCGGCVYSDRLFIYFLHIELHVAAFPHLECTGDSQIWPYPPRNYPIAYASQYVVKCAIRVSFWQL